MVDSIEKYVLQLDTTSLRTMKGSSGSPVFNSNWNIVALHHSGGVKRVSESLIAESKYRNEGIHINKIIDFFVSNHRL